MQIELSSIKVGQPAHRALQGAGITTLKQLASFKESELMSLHGIGPKALGILKTVLYENGLSFKKEDDW